MIRQRRVRLKGKSEGDVYTHFDKVEWGGNYAPRTRHHPKTRRRVLNSDSNFIPPRKIAAHKSRCFPNKFLSILPHTRSLDLP